MITPRFFYNTPFTKLVKRYPVYRRPSNAIAAFQLLLRATAIGCKLRLALTFEEQR
jgi:hypothetical protein